MKVNVLGVKIDDINMQEALMVVEKWVWNPGRHYIVTPNPEMIVVAQKDEIFKEVLNGADLSIPDGVGLKLSGKVKNTFAGVDFMEQLIKVAAEKGFTISFLGGKREVAEKCAERLKKKYSGLKVVFAESGGEVDKDGNMVKEQDLKLSPTDVLFVAFGHQKQEKWIAKNLNKIPAHVIMGVGGSFDYLSGKLLRAPKTLRTLGLEWLFRLVLEPWRIKRQLALIEYIKLLALQ